MNGEIICVGTELLLGDTLNTNSRYLSSELASIGINVFFQSVVGDNFARLQKTVGTAMSRSDLIVLTGGLGPTGDDITKEAVASLLGIPLVEDKESLRLIEQRFRSSGRTMTQNNAKQALAPKGSIILQNDVGTAPGCIIELDRKILVLLPGPPHEMTVMFENYVRPYLIERSDSAIVSHNILVTGIGESAIAEKLRALMNGSNPTVSPYASIGQVTLRVTAGAVNSAAGETLCLDAIDTIKRALGSNVAGIDKTDIGEVVVSSLKEHNMVLATAESCTAGMISARLTDVSGASKVFEIGISAYSNDIKVNALGVSQELIDRVGAVSPEVAADMARGIRRLNNSDLGLAVTGVAGPNSSESKPVGLVYAALADRKRVWVLQLNAGEVSDRNYIREYSTVNALDLCRRYLDAMPDVLPGGTLDNEALNVMHLSDLTFVKNEIEKPAAPENRVMLSDAEISSLMAHEVEDTEETPAVNSLAADSPEDMNDIDFVSGDEIDDVPEVLQSDGENADNMLLGFFDDSDDENEDSDEKVVIAKKKKKGFFKRLRDFFIPRKGDKPIEKIRKIVFLVALAALIASIVYLISYFTVTIQHNAAMNNLRSIWNEESDNLVVNDDGTYARFDKLRALNPDIRAWIKIDNTNINNPVYQTTDNEYYVNHNMNKQFSRYGALFIDYRAIMEAEEQSQNIVIYGHSMLDNTMFGDLYNYRNLDYYQKAPVIQLDTLYGGESYYKIFAVFITNASAAEDKGSVFNYINADFDSQDDFAQWIKEVRVRSIIVTPVSVGKNDDILTLSTCTSDFNNARLVVMARKVLPGETLTVNVAAAYKASNPLYPQAWYDKYGGGKPTLPWEEDIPFFDDDDDDVSSTPSSSEPASSSESQGGGYVPTEPDESSEPATTSIPSVPVSTSEPTTSTSEPPSSSDTTTSTDNPPPETSSDTTTSSDEA